MRDFLFKKLPMLYWFKLGRLSFVLPILLMISTEAHATGIDLRTSVLGQVRENVSDLSEVPVNGYFGLTLKQPSWKSSLETDMRLFRDFSRELDDYDLYQAVMHIRPIEMLQVDFGRQVVNEGFSLETMDGLRLVMMPSGYLDVDVYFGIPRSVETGDFDKDDGLLSGISLGLKNVAQTSAQLHAAWRKNDIHQADLRENDSFFVGVNASHQFSVFTRPMFYGLFEYDVTGKAVDAGTAGLDLYPARWVSLNAEFNFFDINRRTNRPSIFSLFSNGPLYTGRLASTWTILPDNLSFVQSYAYQWLEIQDGSRHNGHLIDSAFQISLGGIGLDLEPGYYFSQSFGGFLNGVRLFLHEQFTDKWYSEVGFDFASYSKVTHNNDNAFSTVLWTGYELPKGVTLSAGFEFNQNNAFNQDVRGSFKVDYRFKHGI